MEINFDFHFDTLFREILTKANEFVPAEGGAILLDDPETKYLFQSSTALVFAACFGPHAGELIGRRVSSSDGIAGFTYSTGESYLSSDEANQRSQVKRRPEELGFAVRSIVSVPIVLENSVCGVLELVNHQQPQPDFSRQELDLLKIFAGYISTSIINALEAKRSKELSRRDDLTGLFNDRFFHYQLMREVQQAKSHGRSLGLLFMDLDNFKQINDNHGHLVGSRTLREIGKLLAATVRAEGATVARYGGDEFVAVFPGLVEGQLRQIAEDIRRAIAASAFDIEIADRQSGRVRITGLLSASIGIAVFAPSNNGAPLEDEINRFIRQADQAMYLAKAQGKNLVICAEEKKAD